MKIKLSILSNLLIIIFTVFATVVMFNGFEFMEGEIPLSIKGLGAIKYFTVESNIMMGIIAIIFFYYEIKLLKEEIDRIPRWVFNLKFIFTVCVAITMITTIVFLAPTTPFGYFSMFRNANFFYHFMIPFISIITFLFFEGTDKIRYRYTFASVIPILLYACFYMWNAFTHLENGMINYIYDWYGVFYYGISNIICVVPIMIGSTYIIGYLLWFFNRRNYKAMQKD